MDMRVMEVGITTAVVVVMIAALIGVHLYAGSFTGLGYAAVIILFCISMAFIGFKLADMACGTDECED
ncbi:MAG: hypothetical protein ACXQT3_05000 [Methermicoccaceae archaeon]